MPSSAFNKNKPEIFIHLIQPWVQVSITLYKTPLPSPPTAPLTYHTTSPDNKHIITTCHQAEDYLCSVASYNNQDTHLTPTGQNGSLQLPQVRCRYRRLEQDLQLLRCYLP
ncbi:hypothetical protein VTJ04DRAFT_9277 [Mycothermus thermophilus]|uniref:uncharacterized protein n=1 Tax=Humicola insolens TaxID=85995 RepID=UPI0037441412